MNCLTLMISVLVFFLFYFFSFLFLKPVYVFFSLYCLLCAAFVANKDIYIIHDTIRDNK